MDLPERIVFMSFSLFGIIAAIFLYFALSLLIAVKKKWWHRGLLLFGCWLISVMIIYIGDLINLSFSMLFFLIILWCTCEGTGLKKLTLGLMFASTIFAFNGFYDNCAGFFAHYWGIDALYGHLYLIARLLFALILYLGIRMRNTEPDFELSSPLWRLMFLLTLSPLGIMLSLILLRSPYMRINGTIFADSALFLVVILSFAGLLRALTVLEKQQRLESENMLALQNQRYYKAMEQQQFETRRLRHDLSNHLQILLALPPQQKDAYIKGMLDNPSFKQIFTWCGDTTVNIVLTAKEERMRQNGIRFFAKVDIKEQLPFDKADLCAILANALDNAVEACLELAEDLREIHLNAGASKGVLAINIRNAAKSNAPAACKEKPDVKNVFWKKASPEDASLNSLSGNQSQGKSLFPKTTKKDVKNHGLGLRSIQETVRKYGGSMEIKQEDGSFNLFLYLPL